MKSSGVNYGWSFRDRPFALAVLLSLAWHFFWFFSLTIVVSPSKGRFHPHPRIVSLGPVLDDTIFRTLVEQKPEISQTFYRHWSDFAPPVDVEVQTIERRSPGDVVSLPLGKRFLESLREFVGGQKAAPDYEFVSQLPIRYKAEEAFRLEGEVEHRPILNRPEEPAIPSGFDLSSKEPIWVEFDFIVEPSGKVGSVEVALSSGQAKVDRLLADYLKSWQFAPLGLDKPAIRQHGRIRFRLGPQSRR